MTPNQQAQKLVDKFYKMKLYYQKSNRQSIYIGMVKSDAKECALVCVDEILKALTNVTGQTLNGEYWQEVKKEIEKL